MLLQVVILLLSNLSNTLAQFGDGNANEFVDSMLRDVMKSGENEIELEDEKFVLVVDLLFFKPQLHLEIRNGVFKGLNSLSRSSDAIVTYDESAGRPVFTISSSLLLSNISMVSAAQGKIMSLGFGLTMPNIGLDVTVEGVDIASVIDLDLKDLTELKPLVRNVTFKDVGHINVGITGLSNELDTLISPITTLVVNTVKRDIQELITPVIQNTLQTVINENAPTDLSQIFG
ncbi:uncharacterized protein LOC111696690 isoform X3 [Eurytemora carolleeae]|nr:uncharacterized protein LOC111696690 isoform X3 [Eurytemora carolleeae]|eukprot:XP_023322159.1 uncharacterized protein LOC111696690 isoform X3 [Eurytemora affinis]